MTTRLHSFAAYLGTLKRENELPKAEAGMNNVFAGKPVMEQATKIFAAHKARIMGQSSPQKCDEEVRKVIG